ncbi:MAG: polysaccharide lyase [Halanaerobiales bacterium]
MQFEKKVDFKNHKTGKYTADRIEDDWGGPLSWIDGISEGRANIVTDLKSSSKSNSSISKSTDKVTIKSANNPTNISNNNSNVLECTYIADKFGPHEAGVQWKSPLTPRNEYFLEYKLKFDEGFEWVRGGKLPGLAGGSTPTGGHPEPDGFSSRYMWRPDGEYELYLYWSGQSSIYGDMVRPGVSFSKGVWHNLKQHVKLNDPGQDNGIIELWIDDERIYSRDNFKFRLLDKDWQIDCFLFSTFYGGNDQSWAPEKNNYIRFNDFKIFF